LRLKSVDGWRTLSPLGNRGDVSSVISHYDPSLIAIFKSELVDYAQYVKNVRELMGPDRQRMNMDVRAVRTLGANYVLVDGRVHTFARDGVEHDGLFSLVYARTVPGPWRFIYVHAPPPIAP